MPNPAVNCVPGATPVNFKLTLTPATATNPVGTSHTVTATLTDTAGTPIAGAPISFTVTGVNTPSPGSGTTNASGQATFTYTGTNTGQDQIAACYDADSSPPCEATASATKDWTPVSDLRITKTGPANGVVGGPLSYTLTVTNGGPSGATNVVVNDPVPAGTTFVSATPSQGTCDNTVSCNLGNLASGSSATITIALTATTVGTVTNTASVTADEPDSDATNNSASASTEVFGFGTGGGAFVVGDRTATGAVTFWGAQWSKRNVLSGGAAPAAFKGFALNPATPGLRRRLDHRSGQQRAAAARPAARLHRGHRGERSDTVRLADLRRYRSHRDRPDERGLRPQRGPRRHGHGRGNDLLSGTTHHPRFRRELRQRKARPWRSGLPSPTRPLRMLRRLGVSTRRRPTGGEAVGEQLEYPPRCPRNHDTVERASFMPTPHLPSEDGNGEVAGG